MDTWQILIILTTVAWGTLMFLSLVANELDAVQEDLRALEKTERRAREKRRETDSYAAAAA